MNAKEFKEVPYTIQIDWEKGVVWLNNHISKEKFIVTEKDAKSIMNDFKLINAKKQGLF